MKRRSLGQSRTKKNTYGPKRASGNMMYGPHKPVPKYPKFYEDKLKKGER